MMPVMSGPQSCLEQSGQWRTKAFWSDCSEKTWSGVHESSGHGHNLYDWGNMNSMTRESTEGGLYRGMPIFALTGAHLPFSKQERLRLEPQISSVGGLFSWYESLRTRVAISVGFKTVSRGFGYKLLII